MRRHPAPPPLDEPDELDALFLSLRRASARVTMDEDFPARVEAAIRAREARVLPGWAAVAAAIALALGAGLLRGEHAPHHALQAFPQPPAAAPPARRPADDGEIPTTTEEPHR